MIYAERSPTSRTTVYTVRCDSCKQHKHLEWSEWNDPPGSVYLLRQLGYTAVLGKDVCNACYADGKTPAISSSWDVSGGEVRESVVKGIYGVTVTVGDGWTKTPAQFGRQIERSEQKLRLRAAMQGMANVMAQVRSVLYELRDELRDWQDAQRESSSALHATCWQPEDRERMSALWSARVREGVARIRPLGPRVYCEGDDE